MSKQLTYLVWKSLGKQYSFSRKNEISLCKLKLSAGLEGKISLCSDVCWSKNGLRILLYSFQFFVGKLILQIKLKFIDKTDCIPKTFSIINSELFIYLLCMGPQSSLAFSVTPGPGYFDIFEYYI